MQAPDTTRALEPTIHALAILDGYRVRWSRETVARDIVQNFFDEVSDFRQIRIEVDDQARTVRVSGPSVFELEYLYYIGATSKRPELRKAGGFGEGFKVCALVLLRDYGVALTAGSGSWQIRPFLRPMSLGRELCYEVARHEPGFEGSYVVLEQVDPALRRAFAQVGELFRHPENPRLAKPMHIDPEGGLGVYFAQDAMRGDLFYRGQHRGTLRFSRGFGLTFVFDDRVLAIDADRDRRNIRAAGPILTALAKRLPDAILERIVLHLRRYWSGGSSILGVFIKEAEQRGLRLTFPRRWLARGKHAWRLEQHAERIGYNVGLERLGAIGMPGLRERFGEIEKPRPPTGLEAARMNIMAALYEALLGIPPRPRQVRVLEVGEIDRFTDLSGRWCVVPARALRGQLREGIGDCLYALAVQAGQEAVNNGDRLTRLLEQVIARPARLEAYESLWDRAGEPAVVAALPDLLPSTVDDELHFDWPQIAIRIHSPPGIPPVEALNARLKALCRELKIACFVFATDVCGPSDAMRLYARGVPSIWIGAAEIEPRRDLRPAYAPRTFSNGRLLPDEAVLREALLQEKRRARRGRMREGNAFRLGERAYERWLKANTEEGWRMWRCRKAMATAAQQLPVDHAHRFNLDAVADSWAKRAIEALVWDEPSLEASALRLRTEALRRARGLAAESTKRWLRLETASLPHSAIMLVHRSLTRQLGLETPLETVRAALDALLSLVMAVQGWTEEAPLDSSCASSCQFAALNVLSRLLDEVSPEEALDRARERFDASVEHALERHDRVDGYGDPLRCEDMVASLRAMFADFDPPKPEKVDVAGAVRAAWEEAMAEGRPEMEAMQRCLEVAERVSPPP